MYFTLLILISHHWKTFLHLSFSFWTLLFYLTLFAVHFPLAFLNYTVNPCNFQLDKQIFIHCYVLLVLVPEPVFYIWLQSEPCIRYSLAAFRQSPRQISNLTSYIFNSAFVASSVIIARDKRSLCGSGRWRPIDLLPWLFSPSCFVKKGVGWQYTTSTSSQNAACSVET